MARRGERQAPRLRPLHANANKRLVKTPKVYFTDTGTLCYLTGLRDPAHAAAGPLGGPLFETAVVTEVLKAYRNRGVEPAMYFWRTATGSEVDLVVDHEGQWIPVEVKPSATPNPRMATGIQALAGEYGTRVGPGFVVGSGKVSLPLAPGIQAIPFQSL